MIEPGVTKKDYLWMFLFSSVIRLATFCFLLFNYGVDPGLSWIDSTNYVTLARNLLAGNGFSLQQTAPFLPDILRTPGYPVFVAFHLWVFHDLWSASLSQVFLNALLPVFGMWLAIRLTGKRSVAILAGLLIALEPHLLIYTLSLSTEGIFIVFLVACLFFLFRYLDGRKLTDLSLCALLLGAAAITRPVFVAFIPVAVCIIVYRPLMNKIREWRKITASVLLLVLLALLPIAPWMYRNYRVTGVATLSTIGWVNMYTRLALTTEAAATDQSWAVVYTSSLERLKDQGVISRPAEMELYQAKYIPLLKSMTMSILMQHPKELIMLQPISLNALFTGDNIFYMLSRLGYLDRSKLRPSFSPSLMLQQKGPVATLEALWPYFTGAYLIMPFMRVIWYLILFAALYGTWDIYKKGDARQRETLVIGVIVIAFFAATLLPVAASIDARYRVAFEPIYLVLSAAGFIAFASNGRRRRTPRDRHATCLLCGSEADLVSEATTKGDNATTYAITDSALGRHNDLYLCKTCGAVSQPFPGGVDALAKAYATQPKDAHYLAEEHGRRRAFAEVLTQAERYVPKGRVLDIGGGPGLFLLEARQHGWQVEGIEPSTASVRIANESYGLGIVQGTVSDLARYPDGRFDLVTAFDVAEHLLDPSKLFSEVRRILRPGGLFVWTTPRYGCLMQRLLGRWWYNLHPFHVCFFTQKSVDQVAKRFGFQCLEERSFKRYFSFGYFLFRLERFLPKSVANALRRSRMAKTQIPIQLYDEFELYFKKG